MKAWILLLLPAIFVSLAWAQASPNVYWQEVGPNWFDPYLISPVYVQRIDFTYDKLRSAGNYSSKTLTNQIEPGFPTTIKSHNYTYFKNATFEDGWFVHWFDEHKIKGLLMPPSVDVLQPTVTANGQLAEDWATRFNFNFGKKDVYSRGFMYWTEFKIPIAKCKEVHVRENLREYKVPFVASILLSDGQKILVGGNYHLSTSSDLDIKTRDRECPFKLSAPVEASGVKRTELKPTPSSAEEILSGQRLGARRSDPTQVQGSQAHTYVVSNEKPGLRRVEIKPAEQRERPMHFKEHP